MAELVSLIHALTFRGQSEAHLDSQTGGRGFEPRLERVTLFVVENAHSFFHSGNIASVLCLFLF